MTKTKRNETFLNGRWLRAAQVMSSQLSSCTQIKKIIKLWRRRRGRKVIETILADGKCAIPTTAQSEKHKSSRHSSIIQWELIECKTRSNHTFVYAQAHTHRTHAKIPRICELMSACCGNLPPSSSSATAAAAAPLHSHYKTILII